MLLPVLFIIHKTNAQEAGDMYADSNYVDTISMSNPDSIIEAAVEDSETTYNDQDDGYVDTTVKHIYDTSQYFFNLKNDYSDVFINKKISQRNLIDSAVNALKRDDDFWYIPAIEKLETRLRNDPKFRDSLLSVRRHELTDERENSFLYQPWFNTLLWVIVICIFAAAVIYFLIQNKISLFSKEAASVGDDISEELHEDIFSLSYTKLIQNAEKENDYRLAVRLMFLQVLKLLSDTNHIHYQPDYTNLHYLQQLQQSKYYNEFYNTMRSYEYVWYGRFELSPEQYKTIKNDFLKLQYKIE